MKSSELWKEENTRIEFWLSANKIFQQEDLSAEVAASFFEVAYGSIAKLLATSQFRLRCQDTVTYTTLQLWNKSCSYHYPYGGINRHDS